jgi:hypothetical protein
MKQILTLAILVFSLGLKAQTNSGNSNPSISTQMMVLLNMDSTQYLSFSSHLKLYRDSVSALVSENIPKDIKLNRIGSIYQNQTIYLEQTLNAQQLIAFNNFLQNRSANSPRKNTP